MIGFRRKTCDLGGANDFRLLYAEFTGRLPDAFIGRLNASQWWCRLHHLISQTFEHNRRRLDLTFNHHAEVAALPPDEADALLDWCEKGR